MVRAMNYGIHEAKSFIADSLLNVDLPQLDVEAAKLYATCKDPYGRSDLSYLLCVCNTADVLSSPLYNLSRLSVQYAIMLRDGMGDLVSDRGHGQRLLNISSVSLLNEALNGVPRAIHMWALLLNHNFITISPSPRSSAPIPMILSTKRTKEVTRLWTWCANMGNATSQRHLSMALRLLDLPECARWRLEAANQVCTYGFQINTHHPSSYSFNK
jgi:hypothetical protein